MDYPIPASPEEIIELRQQPVDEELVAAAIAGVISCTRSQGRSLNDLEAEVLAEDGLLEQEVRLWLRDIVVHAWENLP